MIRKLVDATCVQKFICHVPRLSLGNESSLRRGDWIALHVLQTGTHLGTPELPVLGGMIHNVAPTGKVVSVPSIHLYWMQDGVIIKHSAVRDDLGMIQQMGLLPETLHAAGDMSRPAR